MIIFIYLCLRETKKLLSTIKVHKVRHMVNNGTKGKTFSNVYL